MMKDGVVYEMTPEEEALYAADSASRIEELKERLFATDYKTLKYVEGELSAEGFAASCTERAAWRAEINELESAE